MKTKVCTKCGSDDLRLDAYAVWDTEAQEWVLGGLYDAVWDTEAQEWVLGGLYDAGYCVNCDTLTEIETIELSDNM